VTGTTVYDSLLSTPLNTQLVGRTIVPFDEIDSTNTYALEHGDDGTVVVADRQTAGRGRLGRSWHSAPSLGLWFTVALTGAPDGLSFAAALAVRDALAPRASLKIKWPNDLLCHGKKVCGILVEHRVGRTALGIGLNVHHRAEDFPAELRAKAGSLESELGGKWDRAEVLRTVLKELDRTIMLIRGGKLAELHRTWAQACALEGRRIRCGAIEGHVREIDHRGALIIETANGLEVIYSGDLEYLDEH
jgi:BirA family biotin operon repressor/biotin-[acetyl-CoA-carboxylase] ligase